ncbi:NlpC/P60 family protein [Longispora sp. K20-0274]|uniref:C40 family peptidase n=1 Tax=Longispora sp. K20-0274 TaxID=3088255 RepID=UPI00399BD822
MIAQRALAAVLALAIVASTGAGARAEPGVDELERQLDQQWEALEGTVEAYNKAAGTLRQITADTAAASARVKPLQDQVDAVRARVGALAAAAYRGGAASTANVVLSSGSATRMLDQLTVMEALSHTQVRRIAEVDIAKAPLDAQKARLQKLLGEQQKLEAELAAKKVAITTTMSRLQEQRKAAYLDRASRDGVRDPYVPPYVPGKPGIAVRAALKLLGKPYIWGVAGPDGYDCSGLTLAAWAAAGVQLGHFTGWQWDQSRRVSRELLQPGDLVFWYPDLHHMGMYIGDGRVIHAPQPGDVVKIAMLDKVGPVAGFGRPAYS